MSEMNNNNQTPVVSDKPENHFFRASAADFKKIPGSPIAYWISEKVINAFENESPLYENYPVKSGIMTGNDPLFLRLWYEVQLQKVSFNLTDANKMNNYWYPLSRVRSETITY